MLAPGPDGPVSTDRFEMFREGLQQCEARMIIERALADEAVRSQLGEPLAKRCKEVLDERERIYRFVMAGRGTYGEGWQWYQNSGWEKRAAELFASAGEVTRALTRSGQQDR